MEVVLCCIECQFIQGKGFNRGLGEMLEVIVEVVDAAILFISDEGDRVSMLEEQRHPAASNRKWV